MKSYSGAFLSIIEFYSQFLRDFFVFYIQHSSRSSHLEWSQRASKLRGDLEDGFALNSDSNPDPARPHPEPGGQPGGPAEHEAQAESIETLIRSQQVSQGDSRWKSKIGSQGRRGEGRGKPGHKGEGGLPLLIAGEVAEVGEPLLPLL